MRIQRATRRLRSRPYYLPTKGFPTGGLPIGRTLDIRHVTGYVYRVIKTFADSHTRDLYATGRSRRFPPDIAKRATRKLEYIDLATRLDDLKVPPGNRLHALERDRKGQYSIAVNDQWRVCFRFVDGDAYDVEIADYH